jgi:hypothetical protein
MAIDREEAMLFMFAFQHKKQPEPVCRRVMT